MELEEVTDFFTSPPETKQEQVDEFDKKIICGEAISTLQDKGRFPDNHFDLTVFSPPYDGLRVYEGIPAFDFHDLGFELYRVTKVGGMVVMVIQDQTVNGRKTLTSFRTVTDWCTPISEGGEIGFGLWETVIYQRHGKPGGWWSKRLRVDHEYAFCFIKGDEGNKSGTKPNYFDKEPVMVPSKHAGKIWNGSSRDTSGALRKADNVPIPDMKCPGTIWDLGHGNRDNLKSKQQHPAPYPDLIPYRFIQMFCPENGIVLDPMVGSGSTCVAAKILGRDFVGIDISEEYCEIARQRLREDDTRLTDI